MTSCTSVISICPEMESDRKSSGGWGSRFIGRSYAHLLLACLFLGLPSCVARPGIVVRVVGGEMVRRLEGVEQAFVVESGDVVLVHTGILRLVGDSCRLVPEVREFRYRINFASRCYERIRVGESVICLDNLVLEVLDSSEKIILNGCVERISMPEEMRSKICFEWPEGNRVCRGDGWGMILSSERSVWK